MAHLTLSFFMLTNGACAGLGRFEQLEGGSVTLVGIDQQIDAHRAQQGAVSEPQAITNASVLINAFF